MKLRLPRSDFAWPGVHLATIACIALFLLIASSGAAAQAPERHGSAHFSFALVDMRATALPSSPGGASVEIDHVLNGFMFSQAYGESAETVADSIDWQDGEPYPWATSASVARALTSAYATDALYTHAQLSAEATQGEGEPWVAANSNAFTYVLLTLSAQSTLSMVMHVTADSEGYVGRQGGYYGFELAVTSEDGQLGDIVRKDFTRGPYDEFVTVSLTNAGIEPMGVRWSAYGYVNASLVPVPEPSVMAMLAAGIPLLGVPGMRRRSVGVRR